MPVAGQHRYLLAEYCPGPFYHGWWLYLRLSNAATHRGLLEFGATGWLRDEFERRHAHRMCSRLCFEPPDDHHEEFAEWFAATFPDGLRVSVGPWRELRLIARCKSRPSQRRGCVRTIRGALMADRSRS